MVFIWLPSGWLDFTDRIALAILPFLAWAILISSLDDVFIDLAWAWSWVRSKIRFRPRLYPPGTRQLESAPQQRIAVLVPLWNESGVIASMLEHNLAALRYGDYHIFAGCYPNDPDTIQAVESVAARFRNVHVCVCPHDGPTSKADCLNWTYQHLLLHEEETRQTFDVIVIHDAEDVIHPDELRWINYYTARYDFVQVPVLALPTPIWAGTHGVYCDEFAEYHSRDMTVRASLGGFLPSSGVGTGYRRSALDRLAGASANRIFEPGSLTEDYENGLRLFRLGCTQAFVPISRSPSGDFMATREFFPSQWSMALRQRTRWVVGIALQGWQRFGWSGRMGEVYWLWRDRKGLLGNPLSLLANAMFVYGVATSLWTRLPPAPARLVAATLALQLLRASVRIGCSARLYGWFFALGVPIRAVYANALNSCAVVCAVFRYGRARIFHQPLRWLKTEHSYPTRTALVSSRRRLGEILILTGSMTRTDLDSALESRPPGRRLGEHLVTTRRLTEESLYEALSLQQALPVVHLEPEEVPASVARSLPETVMERWRVLPFRVENGSLCVAGPEPPSAKMTAELSSLTSLEVRYYLVTPARFEKLTEALL